MKTLFILIVNLSLVVFLISCDTKPKKEKHAEVSVEMKKINDTLLRATITTVMDKDGNATEEVKVIEGTPGVVKAKFEEHKSKVLHDKPHQIHQKVEKKLQFSLEAKSGSDTSGIINLSEKEGYVTLEAHINGLDKGIHAIHIHEKADCSADNGKSAGGHWNPTFQAHGAWGDANGFHRGDIGNFIADTNGHGMITFKTDLWCLGCDDKEKNLMGKAIIVHQGEDDLTSQPSGAAGARVSCAGIIK
mgnify:CR=1 FL=1|tara:strand:- start:980 stop:1717 length:738 start_codon:yes stop_codon:yes gene_type:complete